MLGVTVTNEKGTNDWRRIAVIREYQRNRKFVSFEPLLRPLPKRVSLSEVNWMIIGALSKGRGEYVQPEKEWVRDIVGRSKELGIPVFMKGTLTCGLGRPVQEYPRTFSQMMARS